MSDAQSEMLAALDDVAALAAAMKSSVPIIAEMADRLIAAFRGRGKLLTCGNGGSAAEALHLAEELVGRYRLNRKALPAICLAADPTALTCIANDWEYADVFSRQVEAHGRPGDILVVLSTSGRSASIVRALETAKRQGLTTLGLLGPSGSPAELFCDLALNFEGHDSPRIQEGHLIAIHFLLERIDAEFADLSRA